MIPSKWFKCLKVPDSIIFILFFIRKINFSCRLFSKSRPLKLWIWLLCRKIPCKFSKWANACSSIIWIPLLYKLSFCSRLNCCFRRSFLTMGNCESVIDSIVNFGKSTVTVQGMWATLPTLLNSIQVVLVFALWSPEKLNDPSIVVLDKTVASPLTAQT